MKKNYGLVEFEGKTYELTQEAYADNYGTNGEICYKAFAKLQGDAEDNTYLVIWETTDTWNEYTELHNEYLKENDYTDNNSDWIAYLEDGSNACDWDNPISVEKC